MTSRRLLLAICASGLLALGSVHPAWAGPSNTSTASVTVTGGSLEIAVNTASRNLGSSENSRGGATISGTLGEVVVSDRRNAPAGSGWVASVVSTDFNPSKGPAIPASRVGYSAGKIEKVGSATYTANNPKNLNRTSAVVIASQVTGDNTATWSPTISVDVPRGIAAGVYTGMITHSVL